MNLTRAALALIIIIPLTTATDAHAATYREDFSTPGRWPASISVYDGGKYRPADSLSVHDGVLDVFMFNRWTGTAWQSVSSAILPAVGGKYLNTRYGSFDWSMAVSPQSGGLAGWHVVAVLWPESNNPADGEIDHSEWHFGGSMNAFVHKTGALHAQNCKSVNMGPGPGGWNWYTIRWTPTEIQFWLNGQLKGSTTCGQPLGRMHLVIQVSADGLAPGNSFGHLYMDWLAVS